MCDFTHKLASVGTIRWPGSGAIPFCFPSACGQWQGCWKDKVAESANVMHIVAGSVESEYPVSFEPPGFRGCTVAHRQRRCHRAEVQGCPKSDQRSMNPAGAYELEYLITPESVPTRSRISGSHAARCLASLDCRVQEKPPQ